MPLPAADGVVSALDHAYADVTAMVADLDDNDLLLPSGCRGWSIADLLYHMLQDAQRALVAFATPADGHIATLVTEAVIHHFDLIASRPDAPAPAPAAMAIAVSTMEGLAAPGGLPAHWDARAILLKGSGRAELDDTDRRALGSSAALLPRLS